MDITSLYCLNLRMTRNLSGEQAASRANDFSKSQGVIASLLFCNAVTVPKQSQVITFL